MPFHLTIFKLFSLNDATFQEDDLSDSAHLLQKCSPERCEPVYEENS